MATSKPLVRPDFDLTDLGNAERFVDQHGDEVRWVEHFGRHKVWDGQRWRDDDTRLVEARMTAVIKELKVEAALNDDSKVEKHALRSEAVARIKGAIELAKSQPGIAVRPDDFDTDQTLFNVENGTYYLDAAALLDHDRRHLITKLAPVVFQSSANAPRWGSFLERVLPDPELRSFMQRLIGYCLVGCKGEPIIPIVYGTGANGKTVFFEVVRRLFGDYAQTASAESLLVRRKDAIRNDIAAMRGARLVIATEPEEGGRLAVSLLKRMTGGEPMRARFLYGEEFEFVPQFVPFLVTNHKPVVTEPGEAIWRRIRLIPFTVTIPPEERDTGLIEKLTRRRELSGILNWAVAGYDDYVDRGRLDEPDAVLVATDDYRKESDTVGEWLDECTDEHGLTSRKDVLAAYQEWAKRVGTDELSTTKLAERLRMHGIEGHRTKSGRFWKLRLLDGEEAPG